MNPGWRGAILGLLAALAGAGARAAPVGERSLCTADDTREARCYEASEPGIYLHSRAVARLLVNGTLSCTGWLVGERGHLLTAAHCIPDSATAAHVQVELGAEGTTCATDCRATGACAGEVVAQAVTLIHTNADLDYSLVRLPVNPTADYGFLQLRPEGASVGERLYVPQHPGGWGRRIAVESTYPGENGGVCHVVSVSEAPCRPAANAPYVGYYADTSPGASGSPVIAYADHRVVALNLCHGTLRCETGLPGSDTPNRGAPVAAIIADLGADLPLSAVAEILFSDGFESGDTSRWSQAVP